MFSPMWSLMCTLAARAGDMPAALTQHVMVDAPPVAPGGPFSMLMPLAIVVVIMYFLVFRPQQQELKAHEKLIAGLVKGDEVVTSAGLYGTVYEVQDAIIVVEIADRVRVKFDKSAVKRKLAAASGAPAKEG